MYRDQNQRDFARQLRNGATPAEKRLWYFLRAGKLGVKFRRQAAIGVYIVDFVCFSHNMIVELDGPQHVEDKECDKIRDAWLASRGFRVIRFRNQELDENVWEVVDEIKRVLGTPLPSPPHEGEGTGKSRNGPPHEGEGTEHC